MTEWAHCTACDLKHTRRPDDSCPRCGAQISSGSNNPFATPQTAPPLPMTQTAEGSLKTGVVLGFVFGLWGLIGTAIFAKPLTKKGALYGFLGRLGLTLVAIAISLAVS